IRIEEMINYFHYDYAAPEDGNKFGVTTVLTKCPWNKDTLLLRVGVKAEEITPKGGSNIVFLIDTSGSMFDNDKLPLAQKAFSILADNLKPEDTVSIVTYAGSEEVVLEGAKGSDTEKIKKAVNSLQAYGSTNGEGGIKKAYEIAEKHFIKGGNNRIILATDGDLNVGVSSEAGLISLVEEKRETGVFLSCLGFGTGNYKDNKMEALADHGNGNYSYIDCTAEATRVLKDEMWSTLYTVAKDVKFQVEFNSEKVKGYRLIGYENRAMAAEDFANDKKDGGEVGSGQTVTVLYEIVPTDSALSIPQVESRYGNDNTEKASALTNELLAVNIRYKEPDASESKLLTYPVTEEMLREEMDDDTSFAAGVAEFGMLLRKSEYSGTASYQEIYDRLKSIPEIMEDDFKAGFLYLVKKVSK
ncbi:MAG: von Willebrand factor type A domain-containing protein, partial [Eubacterium sp.]|nr:von Willebrand factor type A domain-containing protein [Eubacterium sp.]